MHEGLIFELFNSYIIRITGLFYKKKLFCEKYNIRKNIFKRDFGTLKTYFHEII